MQTVARSARRILGAPCLAVPAFYCLQALAGMPPGALSIDCNQVVIDERPVAGDVSRDGKELAKYYEGHWWSTSPYTLDNVKLGYVDLALGLGASVATIDRKTEKGRLPLLPGNKRFYVEFEARISSNHRDHWPALWMMPVEHNSKKSDHHQGDPFDYERWLEIDVDEGGFSQATHGVAISWTGIWPNYQRKISPDGDRNFVLDRTQNHVFGVAYDPGAKTLQWWLDGTPQQRAGPEFFPDVALKHRYYLIMGAQSHGLQKPYVLNIARIWACVKN